MKEGAIAIFTGHVYGQVLFERSQGGAHVSIILRNLPPNSIHAIHIHEFGDMSDGCATLGGHWNPKKKNHGSIWIDPVDRHSGDMVNNIQSDRWGRVDFSYEDNLITDITQIYGRSVVIHEGRDDLGLGDNKESSKSGNAGKRLACAIIGRVGK